VIEGLLRPEGEFTYTSQAEALAAAEALIHV
jgi:hypothetical protein